MSGSTLGLILASVTLSACAQMLFKVGVTPAASLGLAGEHSTILERSLETLLRPGVLSGLGLYGIGTILWLGALAHTELSKAYPFVGIGFVLTAVFGHVVFGEVFGAARWIGTILVIGGVLLIAQS